MSFSKDEGHLAYFVILRGMSPEKECDGLLTMGNLLQGSFFVGEFYHLLKCFIVVDLPVTILHFET